MDTLEKIVNQPVIADTNLVLELISYIDLTTLSDTDTEDSVLKLVKKANKGFGGVHPAGVCTYSKFGDLVRNNLNESIQTVVVGIGFPSGTTATSEKTKHATEIAKSGANELDIVLNHEDFYQHNYAQIAQEIKSIKTALGSKHLKVILETGELSTEGDIKKASELTCDAGADFIKTSTGKTPVGSTPTAVYQMCKVIAKHYEETGKKIGIKPSGGIRTFEEAAILRNIVSSTLGKEWLTPSLFRIGASSLYDNLIAKYATL